MSVKLHTSKRVHILIAEEKKISDRLEELSSKIQEAQKEITKLRKEKHSLQVKRNSIRKRKDKFFIQDNKRRGILIINSKL